MDDLSHLEQELWLWDQWNREQAIFAIKEMTGENVTPYDWIEY